MSQDHDVTDLATLESLYGRPSQAALVKVAPQLTPAYRRWIAQSRFCFLSTVGPEGTDCSPRGDDGPVVAELDPATLAMPDWRGNNRLDSLRNILRDRRVSLAFMVTGSTVVVRINGRARLSVAPDLLARFARDGRQPRLVIVIAIAEVYAQCARALLRAQLWSGSPPEDLPSIGDILAEQTAGAIDAPAWDAEWAVRARTTMW